MEYDKVRKGPFLQRKEIEKKYVEKYEKVREKYRSKCEKELDALKKQHIKEIENIETCNSLGDLLDKYDK